jgi:hypothetical protein
MKEAFIPPKGLENHLREGRIVMALAQLSDDDNYVHHVRELHARGRFVIVDNGANEKVSFSNEDLTQRAIRLRADELVLPDVLYDAEKTFEVATQYLREREAWITTTSPEPQYMGAVQGDSIDELRKLVDRYSEEFEIKTIGLPRLLLEHVAPVSIRIDMANWIESSYPNRFDIHLLGASTEWVKEPYYVSKYAPHIRSIDTSLPYNYGLQGIRINDTRLKVDRPKDYFTKEHKASGLTTISFNEEVYRSWCSVTR